MLRSVWECRAGSIGNLRLRAGRRLAPPSRGEVAVRVFSVGLNFADVFAVQGLYSATPEGRFTPGLEFAGVVAAVHEDDRGAPGALREGDRVFGCTRFGGYASVVCVDARAVRRLPAGWSFDQGAAFPVQALTAYYGLRALGAVRAGDAVLVHSAAGGVGLAALAICERLGAVAVGTVGSAAKVEVLRRRSGLPRGRVIVRGAAAAFGAQLDAALALTGRDRFAVVLDSLMGDHFWPAHERLARGGRHVVFGAGSMTTRGDRPGWLRLAWRYLWRPRLDPLAMIAENRAVMAFNLIWMWDRLDELGGMLDELLGLGLPPPLVGHRLHFCRAPRALRLFQSGRTVGKVVLALPGGRRAYRLSRGSGGKDKAEEEE